MNSNLTLQSTCSSSLILNRKYLTKEQKLKCKRKRDDDITSQLVQLDPTTRRLRDALIAANQITQSRFRLQAATRRNSISNSNSNPSQQDYATQMEVSGRNQRHRTSELSSCSYSSYEDPVSHVQCELMIPKCTCCQNVVVRTGIMNHLPDSTPGVILDMAMQVRSSYTNHCLTADGTFVHCSNMLLAHPPVHCDQDGYAAESELRCCCQLFRLQQPYQHSMHSQPKEPEPRLNTQLADPECTVPFALRNLGVVDTVHHLAGRSYVLPPHCTCLISDITQANQLLVSHRPPTGFQLVVADPPWKSKSVRRSHRYECMDHQMLLSLPISDLLSHTLPCFVCIWCTHNPRFLNFIRSELMPAWGVRYVATWSWLKVTDDGRTVLPLHASTESNFRKPYELMLVGWRPGIKLKEGRSSAECHTSTDSDQLPTSFPIEYTMISVPGMKHHSRKPQIGGQRPFTYQNKTDMYISFFHMY